MDNIYTNSVIIFFGAIGLTILSLVCVRSAWKTLREAYQTLPPGYRKVFFNLRVVSDKKIRIKLEDISSLFFSSLMFSLNIICNIFSLSAISSIVLGLYIGTDTQFTYLLAAYSLLFGISFMFSGLFLLGAVRLSEAIFLMRGKEYPLYYEPETYQEKHAYEVVLETALGLKPSVETEVKKKKHWNMTNLFTNDISSKVYSLMLFIAGIVINSSELDLCLPLRIVLSLVIGILIIILFTKISHISGKDKDQP